MMFNKQIRKKIIDMRFVVVIISLFIRLPGPGDSEGTFESSSQAAICPSVYHAVKASHCPF